MEYGLPTIFLLTFFLSAVSANTTISIYFESLCPDSKNFIVSQFAPAFLDKGLQGQLTPDFVPYGHFIEANNTCQHGENECKGNILLACGLNKTSGEEGQVKFVQCIMNATLPSNTTAENAATVLLDQCKSVVGESYSQILNCTQTEEGKTLNDMYKTKTNNFFGSSTFGVPYIAVNNTKNDELSKKFSNNFLATFCEQSKANLTVCKNGNSASTYTASLIPLVLALILLIRI